MKAAIAAASASDWTPKTISSETGYLLAEREIAVSGRRARNDAYRLEVNLPSSGTGNVSVKINPPPKVMGGKDTQQMLNEYLVALEQAASSQK
jgi:hypothetical protein